ncbi:MAG: hypothetical protein J5I94_11655, partial [Phaeodactylibacter sp.]|nr:hypothetical protein [Phaeodactylibacter sp.]
TGQIFLSLPDVSSYHRHPFRKRGKASQGQSIILFINAIPFFRGKKGSIIYLYHSRKYKRRKPQKTNTRVRIIPDALRMQISRKQRLHVKIKLLLFSSSG